MFANDQIPEIVKPHDAHRETGRPAVEDKPWITRFFSPATNKISALNHVTLVGIQ